MDIIQLNSKQYLTDTYLISLKNIIEKNKVEHFLNYNISLLKKYLTSRFGLTDETIAEYKYEPISPEYRYLKEIFNINDIDKLSYLGLHLTSFDMINLTNNYSINERKNICTILQNKKQVKQHFNENCISKLEHPAVTEMLKDNFLDFADFFENKIINEFFNLSYFIVEFNPVLKLDTSIYSSKFNDMKSAKNFLVEHFPSLHVYLQSLLDQYI